MTRRNAWEEDTRPNLLRPSLQQRVASAPPPADDDSTLGMLMRQTVNNTTAVATLTTAQQGLRTDFDVLAREVRQSNRAAPMTIQDSATRASNRVAGLMAALFSLYEVSAPYLREAWNQWRAHH